MSSSRWVDVHPLRIQRTEAQQEDAVCGQVVFASMSTAAAEVKCQLGQRSRVVTWKQQEPARQHPENALGLGGTAHTHYLQGRQPCAHMAFPPVAESSAA